MTKQVISTNSIIERFPALVSSDNDGEANNMADGEKIDVNDLLRIRVPGLGSSNWVINSITGETSVKELYGIILSQSLTRNLYLSSFEESGGKDFPICSSSNSIFGNLSIDFSQEKFSKKYPNLPLPTGDCTKCHFSEWGTKLNSFGEKTKGKECQQRRVLLLLLAGASMPVVFSIPPSGLANIKGYLLRLMDEKLKYWKVITRIGLVQDKSSSGIKYSRPTFSLLESIQPENWHLVSVYLEYLKSKLFK